MECNSRGIHVVRISYEALGGGSSSRGIQVVRCHSDLSCGSPEVPRTELHIKKRGFLIMHYGRRHCQPKYNLFGVQTTRLFRYTPIPFWEATGFVQLRCQAGKRYTETGSC